MSSLQIQYDSDLYMNFDSSRKMELLMKSELIYPYESLLVLCGNITFAYSDEFEQILSWCDNHFYAVVFVPGSLEYHGCNSMEDIKFTNVRMKEVCNSLPNVYFLNNKELMINNVRFLDYTALV